MLRRILRRLSLCCLALLAVAGAAAADPFRDVPKDHWAFESVRRLSDRGLLSGFSDDTFRGEKPLTRYAFAVSLAKALEELPAPQAGKKAATPTEVDELRKLLEEFNEELTLLGAKLGSTDEKLAACRRRDEELAVRVQKLEKGERRGVHFDGGELRLLGRNRSAGANFVDTILDAGFDAGKNVGGKLRLRLTSQLDGRPVEGVGAYEAYADLRGLGGPFERLRAGRFNYFMGTGQVLFDRVEGFDLLAGHGRNRYEALYGEDLILQFGFPTVAGGEGGYYYIEESAGAGAAQPFHVGLFFRGPLGDKFSYGMELSDYDHRHATVANNNRRTRGFLSSFSYRPGSGFGVHGASIVQEEDFRAFRIDRDLGYHSDRESPLEDVLQTLDTFSSGATAAKNEINGFTDYKLGLSYRTNGSRTEFSAGLDEVGPHASAFDNRSAAFRIWTAALTRHLAGDTTLQLRLRRLVFEDEDPTRTAGTLPILRQSGGELRAQYFTRF